MNIFLTGERQAGKSTLLNRVLKEGAYSIAGFKTLPCYSDNERIGFYIENMLGGRVPPKLSFISRKISQDVWVPVVETFEKEGVEILKESLKVKPDIILMDELGFLENEALNFKKHVKYCLDSDILVIGVIKPLNTPFLDSIRSREDVKVIEVKPENREKVYEELLALVPEGLKNNTRIK